MRPYRGGQRSTDTEEQKKHGQTFDSHTVDPRTMKRIAMTFYPYRSELVTILAGNLLAALLGLVPSILISFVIDDAIQKGKAQLLVIYVACMAGALILSGVIGVGQTYLSNKLGQNILHDLQNRLYEHLERLPLGFFAETRTSEMQSHLVNDLGEIQGTVTNTASIVSVFSVIVSSTIVMLVISPLLTLIMLVLLPLFLWITYKVDQMQRQTSRENQKSQASLSAQMQETLSVSRMLLVKVFGQQKYAQAQIEPANKAQEYQTLRQLMIGRWFKAVIATLFALMPILVYLVAGEQIVQHVSLLGGTMTIGMMVAFTMLQLRIFASLEELMNTQVKFEGRLALFERIFAYLDLPITISDKPDALNPTPDQIQGQISFRNVHFDYKKEEESTLVDTHEEKRPNDDEAPDRDRTGASPIRPLPLRNITFTIQPGQLAALVGPGGAGKKTICYLLPRLYDVESGEVEIDGVNVKDFALTSLTQAIGVVMQETYLFHTSIRENILYARPDATEEEMIVATQAAAIHERIMELDDGYETVVGEHGDSLSEGEKQRIGVARAILKNPRILIVDEATGSLDAQSERLVQASLEMLMKGRTTLVIAYRPSTLLAADVILVVNKGEIVERGRHQELLASGGLYTRLYDEQFARTPVGAISKTSGLMRETPATSYQTLGITRPTTGTFRPIPGTTHPIPRITSDAPGTAREAQRITRKIADLGDHEGSDGVDVNPGDREGHDGVGAGDRKGRDGVNPSSPPRFVDAPSEGSTRQISDFAQQITGTTYQTSGASSPIPRITRQIPDLSEQIPADVETGDREGRDGVEGGAGDSGGRDGINPSSPPRFADDGGTDDRERRDEVDLDAGDHEGRDGINPSSPPRFVDAPSEGSTRQIPDFAQQITGTTYQTSGTTRPSPRITRQIPDLSQQIPADVGTGDRERRDGVDLGSSDREGRDAVNPSSPPRFAGAPSGSFTSWNAKYPAGSFTAGHEDASSWLSTLWPAEDTEEPFTSGFAEDTARLKYRDGDEGPGSVREGTLASGAQMSNQQPLGAPRLRKTARPTVKLPARVASENDRLSTAFLPPGIREIFAPGTRSQQGVPTVENAQAAPGADDNSTGPVEADIK